MGKHFHMTGNHQIANYHSHVYTTVMYTESKSLFIHMTGTINYLLHVHTHTGITLTTALDPNSSTSLCFLLVKAASKASFAAEAAGPCGSHIPDTQHPIMLRSWGARLLLSFSAQALRALWLASLTRWSLSCVV